MRVSYIERRAQMENDMQKISECFAMPAPKFEEEIIEMFLKYYDMGYDEGDHDGYLRASGLRRD